MPSTGLSHLHSVLYAVYCGDLFNVRRTVRGDDDLFLPQSTFPPAQYTERRTTAVACEVATDLFTHLTKHTLGDKGSQREHCTLSTVMGSSQRHNALVLPVSGALQRFDHALVETILLNGRQLCRRHQLTHLLYAYAGGNNVKRFLIIIEHHLHFQLRKALHSLAQGAKDVSVTHNSHVREAAAKLDTRL